MWAALIAWLGPWFIHNTQRLIGVIIIGSILIGGPLIYGRVCYNKGYNQARKDYPQNLYTGPTTVNQNGSKDSFFILLKIGKFKLIAI